MLILKASALQMRMDRGRSLCNQLKDKKKQLSLLDKREYPEGEGV